jgi:hypothetical protein
MSEVDLALTAQIVVAWAGETGEEKRLSWWRTDLISEYGGQDLFRRLLPNTWPWAVLQGAREAARRTDTEQRKRNHDPDIIVSLFSVGFELDERIEERFQDLKRTGREPKAVLPGLEIVGAGWNADGFWAWVSDHGDAQTAITPLGRCLKGPLPSTLGEQVRRLVAALAPVAPDYPLPHFRKAP